MLLLYPNAAGSLRTLVSTSALTRALWLYQANEVALDFNVTFLNKNCTGYYYPMYFQIRSGYTVASRRMKDTVCISTQVGHHSIFTALMDHRGDIPGYR